MSGVIIIRSLLAANSALTALVPAAKIMTGVIPINTALPSISIAQISGTTRDTIGLNDAKVLTTDRVQVTVMAKTYSSQKNILDIARYACPNTYGLVNGIACDSILRDVVGPDIFDADAIVYFQSFDVIVKYSR